MKAPLKALILSVVALGVSCASYDPDAKIDPGVGQSGPDFYPVALVLNDSCGQIDCHGSKYRNMRLYGFSSERLNPLNTPGSPETTQDEAQQDYESVAALEPTIFLQVIREGGADPERLTFVRKMRGKERHKGGSPFLTGSNGDLCIQSWLRSAVDPNVCKLAVPRLNISK